MKKNNITNCAKFLFKLKLNAENIYELEDIFKPKDIKEAYLIQEELKIQYLSLKNNICIGKKVGCTNKEAQKQVGIHEPFYGNLFSRYASESNCTLKSINFSEPYIEPEISFIVKNDIDISKAPYTLKDIDYLFDGVICSVEIVDFRFKKQINKIGIENLISTNGASDYWIKGKNIFKLDEINLFDNQVSLIINNKIIEEGNTNNVLGNPINSALWLINKVCESGQIMLKGQFISTGSCTKAIKLKPHQNIKAHFLNLETIEFKYI